MAQHGCDNHPTRLTLFAYALLGLPAAFSLPAILLYIVPAYLNHPLQGAAVLIGGGLVVLRLVDAIAPLWLGYLIDSMEVHSGRRRTGWMAGAALLLCGSALFMVVDVEQGAMPLLIGGGVATLGWSMMRVSQLAWAAELTGYYHQRSRLYFAAQIATVLGLLAGMAIPYIAVETGGLQIDFTAAINLGTVVSIAVASLLMLLYLPDPATAPAPERFLASFSRIRLSPSWRRMLIAHSLNIFANTLSVLLIFHIGLDIIGNREIIIPVISTYLIAAFCGLPIGLALARRCGKHQSWSAALIFTVAVLIWLPLLGHDDGLELLILAALIGSTAAIDWTIPAAIQADTVDSEALRNDVARAGFQFGLWLFAGKLAIAAAVLVVLGMLFLGGGSAAIMPGEADGLEALILVLAGLVPAFAKLIAIAEVWSLPLDAAKHKEIQRRLMERRQSPAADKGEGCAAAHE